MVAHCKCSLTIGLKADDMLSWQCTDTKYKYWSGFESLTERDDS
jgi:hypothetical protein